MTLIDGTGAEPRAGVDVYLEQGRIANVGEHLVATGEAEVLELEGYTLLPGFIDAHVHMTFTPPPNYEAGVVREMKGHDSDRALGGVPNAWSTLQAGFTTVRNVGGTFADRALRDAIASGAVPGPRMLVANHAITITGGHCDETHGYRPDLLLHKQDYRAGVADSPDEVRKAVRYQIKHGADVIKVCATAGVMSSGDTIGVAQLTTPELSTAVDEANRAGVRVAAHAHGTQGIREAVEAGVHSIEHGSILDDATVALMKAKGTVLVPTLSAGEHVLRAADAGTLSKSSAAKARAIAPKMRASFGMAYAAGVEIALGSDAGVFAHGKNGREFTLMVGAGMTPMDAIVAGTSGAARLLGISDVGAILEGNHADLVLIQGNPLEDISRLERPEGVIKGGVIYVRPGSRDQRTSE
ncbi:MAG: amidohydrolase family protein [Nannocystaceae bacterium]|nr:amidohydrolase family protein [Nannocystaceae bacterium]